MLLQSKVKEKEYFLLSGFCFFFFEVLTVKRHSRKVIRVIWGSIIMIDFKEFKV